jgi:hypothetical protein
MARSRRQRVPELNPGITIPSAEAIVDAGAVVADVATDVVTGAGKRVAMGALKGVVMAVVMDASAEMSRVSPGLPPRVHRHERKSRVELSSLDRLRDISPCFCRASRFQSINAGGSRPYRKPVPRRGELNHLRSTRR